MTPEAVEELPLLWGVAVQSAVLRAPDPAAAARAFLAALR